MLREWIAILLIFVSIPLISVESSCSKGCGLALASYYTWAGVNLSFISEALHSSLLSSSKLDDILRYNPEVAPNKDSIEAFKRLYVPFPCDCINGQFLGHVFQFQAQPRDTYDKIATEYYANLTTVQWLRQFNSYRPTDITETGTVNVTVNCSCVDAATLKDYDVFITYPIQTGQTLETVLTDPALTRNSSGLLQISYKDFNFSAGTGLVYIPGRVADYSSLPVKPSTRISGGLIAGISVAAIAVLLLLAVGIYVGFFRKKLKGATVLPKAFKHLFVQAGTVSVSMAAASTGVVAASPGLSVDKSVEFSYKELAQATDNFSMANKIGEGGFGAVYYANLRGEEAAIKKMDMRASKEFLAELKVLTHVHHQNLANLIGYCTERSLFLVYKYIGNGNLSQHLRGSSREPLPWSTRVQIAHDIAKGLEYIHEHTVPVYIHRDIKSANILIDQNFHAKVANFGLAKLTEVGSASRLTRLVGTFGYMPPEYVSCRAISPKVDVYAFGVVLYELISAKEAIVEGNDSVVESKGLVTLFEDALNDADPKEELSKLIDPRLGGDYQLDSVLKMAQLARACTQENPLLRPSMSSLVVALRTFSSSTEDWDICPLYENQTLVNLMSAR